MYRLYLLWVQLSMVNSILGDRNEERFVPVQRMCPVCGSARSGLVSCGLIAIL